MDSDNNISTTSKGFMQTSEDVEETSEDRTDPTQNSQCGDRNIAATIYGTTDDSPASIDALPSSTNPIEEDQPNDAVSKNGSSDNDPNSEDIELKWDDDSDVEVSAISDFVSDFIDNDNTELPDKGGQEIEGSGDGKAPVDNEIIKNIQTDRKEQIDVDTSGIEDITEKIDELIKDDDNEEGAKISTTAKKTPKSSEDAITAINLGTGSAHEIFSESTLLADVSMNLKPVSLTYEETAKSLKTSTEAHGNIADKIIQSDSQALNSSESNRGVHSKPSGIKSCSAALEKKPLVAENKTVVTPERNANKELSSISTVAPYSLTLSTLKAVTLEEVSLNLSDAEDDTQLPPSKEEEDFLLAEPTSTNASKIHPDASDSIKATFNACPNTNEMVDASKKTLKVTAASNLCHKSIELSKGQDVDSKDLPLSSAFSESMAIDTVDDILDITDDSLSKQLSKEDVVDTVNHALKVQPVSSDKDQMAAFSEDMAIDTSDDIKETTEKSLSKQPKSTTELSKEDDVVDTVNHTLKDQSVSSDKDQMTAYSEATAMDISDDIEETTDNSLSKQPKSTTELSKEDYVIDTVKHSLKAQSVSSNKDQMTAHSEAMAIDTVDDILETADSSLSKQPESKVELSKEDDVIDTVKHTLKAQSVSSDKDQMKAHSEAMAIDTIDDILEATDNSLSKQPESKIELSKEDNVIDTVKHTLKAQSVSSDKDQMTAHSEAMAIDTTDDIVETTDNSLSTQPESKTDVSMEKNVMDTVNHALKDGTFAADKITILTNTKAIPIDGSNVTPVSIDNAELFTDSAIQKPSTDVMTHVLDVLPGESEEQTTETLTPLTSASNTEDLASTLLEKKSLPPTDINVKASEVSQIALNESKAMYPTESTTSIETQRETSTISDIAQPPSGSSLVVDSSEQVLKKQSPAEATVSSDSNTKKVTANILSTVQSVSDICNDVGTTATASNAADVIAPLTVAEPMVTNSSDVVQVDSDLHQAADTTNIVQKSSASLNSNLSEISKHSDKIKLLEVSSTSNTSGISNTTDTLEIVQTTPNVSEPVQTATNPSEEVQITPDAAKPLQMLPKFSIKTPEAINNSGLSAEIGNQLNRETTAPVAAEMTAATSAAPQKIFNESDMVPETPEPTTSTDNQPTAAPKVPDEGQPMTDTLGLLTESVKVEDNLDDLQEFTDSLGLLAESSGPRDEEEEPEIEEEDDGDDDEEADDDQDDEPPTTADQSEDSNAQTSEDASNPTDIDISEDGFASVGAGGTGVTALAGATETVKDGELDVDNEFDKILAAVAPVKQKPAAGQALPATQEAMEVDELATAVPKDKISILREVLSAKEEADTGVGTPRLPDKAADTPSKGKKLARCSNDSMNVVNIVELEESSSEDDVLIAKAKKLSPPSETKDESAASDAAKEDTVAKPAAPKTRIRLNTDELTIKTAVAGSESTLVIPETKLEDIPQSEKPAAPKFSLEVFNLDSDEEDATGAAEGKKVVSPEKPALPSPPTRCGNPHCQGAATTAAPALKLANKRSLCQVCASLLDSRLQSLISGVKELTPLLDLESARPESDLVEISDSDSDDGGDDGVGNTAVKLGEDGAKLLEDQLADLINDTWRKYELDDRLAAATRELEAQMAQFERDRLDIDTMLDECQVATDALRCELYAAFALPQRQLPAIEIMDTLSAQYAKVLSQEELQAYESEPSRRSKRPRVPSKEEHQAKRPAIPLGFTGDDSTKESTESSQGDTSSKADDDNTDIKVVALSAEAAPAGLPALGALVRQPVAVGMAVYGMKHAFGAWQRATILHAPPRGEQPYSTCKVRFEVKTKNNPATLSARNLAYAEPASVRLTIATRVIALSQEHGNKKKSFYSGVIAEMPNPVNNYRYLVFFDGGYAQYVAHCDTRVVCECSPLVWEEVHPFSREFVREYLRAYPERPMVRLHAGQTIKTEWNGKWWVSRVIRVDASLVEVHFEADNRDEWIYRGSTRLAPLYLELQAAERHRARPLPRSTQGKKNMPYVEYTRSDEQESSKIAAQLQAEQELKRQRAVAKKSTTLQNNQQLPLPALSQDAVMSRVVYYTPKAAVKPHKMVPHVCSTKCRRTDVLPLKELRTYNPLARPLLSGWERQLVRHKGRKEVMYRAPCGRRLRNERELHRYLRAVNSEMAVDLFDFSPTTHCLAEFVLNRCLVSKKDLSHGKENVPVPCVNYYDTSLPEFCSYNTERTPTAGVPLNLDPEFLCGCDCEDDCQDKSKCKCWKLTLDGARTVGQDGSHVGYVYRRLLDPVPSGIYECNSRCKCKQTCLNRVAQHPLQLKLQVFKTPNRGWGIRALNDVPKGSFLCVYAGNLLTDATANLDGLNEGDEYLAELDYIEVVEQMKEGYEDDIPDRDKELDDKESRNSEDTESASSSEDTERADGDGDFRPVAPIARTEFSKRLRRRRDKKEKNKKDRDDQPKEGEKERGDCITISDDEEVREPSRFMAQPGMGSKDVASKYKSVRAFFGEDEACYIMDAKVQGNIGRYLNHSCCPNVFVQNVFVDTHDPRFPWVAFFALSHIRAGTELTWNYNYDVGSVPDKVLYCYCGAPNCRGRLL